MPIKSVFISLTAFIFVVLLTIWIYWAGLSGPFVLDDISNIVSAHIDQPNWSSALYNITHNTSGLFGRSVSVLSFVFTELQFGLDAWGYKFHNLILHILNGMLIFRFLYVALPAFETRIHSTQAILVAAIVSSLWLLHPLLVSTVLYAVQRMVELAAFFSILALLMYLEIRCCSSANVKFYIYGWVLFPLFLVLAILSKETGVLIPVYIIIFELLMFSKDLQMLRRSRVTALWFMVFVTIPMIVGAIYVTTHFGELTNYSSRNFTLYERLLTQLHVVFFYSWTILFPRIKNMSLYQDDFPITHSLDLYTFLLLMLLLLVLVAIWYLRKPQPVLAFGLAWFLGSHLLESTFLPLELVFEHRNYLAAIGILLPPVYYIIVFKGSAILHLQWFLTTFFAILAIQTYSRVQEWSSEGMMVSVAVADHPDSPRARTAYANYLYSQERFEEGSEQLRAAISANPRDSGSYVHLLGNNCALGIRDEALLEQAATALTTWPSTVYTLNALESLIGFISNENCTVLTDEDVDQLLLSALSLPANINHKLNYGFLLRFQGMQAFREGKYASGVIAMRMAYENSGLVELLGELVRFQVELGQLQDAKETLAYIEEVNQTNFGTETYLITELNELLAAAEETSQDQVELVQ